MILCICALNFCNLVTKFTAEAKDSIQSLSRLVLLLLFSLTISFIVGLSLMLVKDAWLMRWTKSAMFVEYFRIAGLLLPFFMMQPLVEGILRGLKHFRLIGILQVSSSLLMILFLALGISYDGRNGAVWGLYIYYLLYALVSVGCLYCVGGSHNHSIKKVDVRCELQALYNIILPVFLLSFVEAPLFWWLQVLLAGYATMEAVGCMTIMKQIRNFSVLIPNYFVSTYVAFAAELRIKKQYKLYFKRFDKYSLIFFAAGCALMVIFSFLSPNILKLYGDTYPRYWYSLVLSNLCIPVVLVLSMIKMELLLQEHQKQLFVISVIWNFAWMALFIIFVKMNIDPLQSFFYSEMAAITLQLALCFILYQRDKHRVLQIR